MTWIYDGDMDIDFYTNTVSSAYAFLVTKSSWYTTCFRCAARTMTTFYTATALNQKDHVDIWWKCGNRFWYKRQWTVHTDTWSWNLCIILGASIALPGRQRYSILQQRQTNRNHVDMRENVDINLDTNTSKQCIPTLGHAVFVGYNVFWVRWEDGDGVTLFYIATALNQKDHVEMWKSVLLQTPINRHKHQ